MLRQRLVTGPLLVLGLLGIIFLDGWVDHVRLQGPWRELFLGAEHPPPGVVSFAACLVVAAMAGAELARVIAADGIRTRPWLMAAAAVLGVAVSYCIPAATNAITTVAVLSTAMIAVFVAALLTFSRHQNVQGVVAAAGSVVFAMVYIGLMLGFFLALRREHSTWWIVGIIFVTKACDTGAFFTGTAIGRHKLIPWLSPGKTWEGLAGGIAASVLTGIALAAASWLLDDPDDHLTLWLGAWCGVLFALVGQFGDLTMSLFKRDAGLKDSSSLLPGMGGVLDVIDSPLMVAPVAFWVLTTAT